MSDAESKLEVVWSMIRDIKIPMVVTHDNAVGGLRGRPMAARTDPDESAIYFLTDAASAKDKEVQSDNHVCLIFVDLAKQKYLSVSGPATMSDDRSKIKQLWMAADVAFWKDSNDPAIRILKVSPASAEYWDSPSAIVTYVEMVKAAITGKRQDLGAHEKVRLS